MKNKDYAASQGKGLNTNIKFKKLDIMAFDGEGNDVFRLDEIGMMEIPKKKFQYFTKDGIVESDTTSPVTLAIKKEDYGK